MTTIIMGPASITMHKPSWNWDSIEHGFKRVRGEQVMLEDHGRNGVTITILVWSRNAKTTSQFKRVCKFLRI